MATKAATGRIASRPPAVAKAAALPNSPAAPDDIRRHDHRRPSLGQFLREVGAWVDLRVKTMFASPPRSRVAAEGRPRIVVIPGFLASDFSTVPLRYGLARAGYRVHGWGLGLNRGVKEDTLDQVERAVARVSRGEPIVLIGWSLGGILAREIAKRRPDLVLRVITLGSPFSGDLRANNMWRTYEWVNGYSVDALPLPVKLHEKPPVPTYALWSRSDGVIAPACARGLPEEADRHIEVSCTHIGFMTCRRALKTLVELIDD